MDKKYCDLFKKRDKQYTLYLKLIKMNTFKVKKDKFTKFTDPR